MPAVLLMEPAVTRKRQRYAGILREPRAALPFDPEEINRRLRAIRSDALDRQGPLLEQAMDLWAQDPDIHLTLARDAAEAVRTIGALAGTTRRIAINKSSVIQSEIVPALEAADFRVIEPYYEQFPPFENRFTEYWQLPRLPLEFRGESFQITRDLSAMRRSGIETHGAREIIGVMGVNAASASDGAILLMQHGHNISDIFTQTREIVLVIGIDKIVSDREAAAFQTQGMALYGSESLLLDLRYKDAPAESFERLPFSVQPRDAGRKIHIVLLDNGRRRLLESAYRELLLCIDCRACARACPVGEMEARRARPRRSPKEYVHFRALRMNSSPRACLQCRRCEGVCPVGIPLPDLILRAGKKAELKLPGALADYIMGNPEALLKRASAVSALYNGMMGIGAFRWLGAKMIGVTGDRRPPRVHRDTFNRWFRSHPRRVSRGTG